MLVEPAAPPAKGENTGETARLARYNGRFIIHTIQMQTRA